MGKLTKAEINKRLEPRGFWLTGEWKGIYNKNQFSCSLGHEWEATASNILYLKSGCPHCADLKHRLSKDEVQSRLDLQGIKLEGQWAGLLAENQYSCNACGHIWKATGRGPVGLGTGCPACNKFPEKMTEAQVNFRLAEYGLSLVGEWHGKVNSNRFRCSLGHEWETKGLAPLEGATGCPECARLRLKNRHAYG